MSDQPKKVLVVDDDQSAVAFVRAALEPEKYEVVGVSDGLAGLLQAREEPPDLIILDVYMPRQPGFYTLKDLRADPKTKNIPVIMLTGVGKRLGITFSTQDIYDFLGIEPDVYLEKPVDPMFLRRVTDRLMGMDSAENGRET
ncbi:MAG: response regulator [Planctomycetota bacterium]|jgi:DNA-binding response OmpR family regulator